MADREADEKRREGKAERQQKALHITHIALDTYMFK